MAEQRKTVDWEAVEREYRAGQLSVAEISRQYGVSRPAIDKRAKKHGWTRNLAAEVRKEVEARLVADEVATCNARQAIEAAAARGVDVVLRHRRDIAKLNDLKARLAEKADALIEQVVDLESLNDASSAIESLGRTSSRLIPLERQAFALDDKNTIALTGPDGGPIQTKRSFDIADLQGKTADELAKLFADVVNPSK